MHTPVREAGIHCKTHGHQNGGVDSSKCYILMLSDEIVLNIFQLLPITSRLNAVSLHSRLSNIVRESWRYVHHFPSKRIGFRFHRDKKRVVFVEDFLPVLLQCKNLKVLRLPSTMREENKWYETGWQLGTRCPFLEKLVGQFNAVEFVLGIVESMQSSGRVPSLTEISVRQLHTVEEMDMLDKIVKGCPGLRTCRILINSLPASVLVDQTLMLQLKDVKEKLKSFIIPQTLSSRIMNQ